MYDTSTEVFVTFSGTLLPIEREIIMYEAVRNFLVQQKDRSSFQQTGPAEWLTNLAMFIGRFVTQYQDLDLYVFFAHMSQNIRNKKHPLEVVIAGCVFDNAFGAASASSFESMWYVVIMAFVAICVAINHIWRHCRKPA